MAGAPRTGAPRPGPHSRASCLRSRAHLCCCPPAPPGRIQLCPGAPACFRLFTGTVSPGGAGSRPPHPLPSMPETGSSRAPCTGPASASEPTAFSLDTASRLPVTMSPGPSYSASSLVSFPPRPTGGQSQQRTRLAAGSRDHPARPRRHGTESLPGLASPPSGEPKAGFSPTLLPCQHKAPSRTSGHRQGLHRSAHTALSQTGRACLLQPARPAPSPGGQRRGLPGGQCRRGAPTAIGSLSSAWPGPWLQQGPQGCHGHAPCPSSWARAVTLFLTR